MAYPKDYVPESIENAVAYLQWMLEVVDRADRRRESARRELQEAETYGADMTAGYHNARRFLERLLLNQEKVPV